MEARLEVQEAFLLSAFLCNLLAKFGANAILGVSLAVCKAGAAERELPLYRHIAQLAGNSDLILPVPVSSVHAWASPGVGGEHGTQGGMNEAGGQGRGLGHLKRMDGSVY